MIQKIATAVTHPGTFHRFQQKETAKMKIICFPGIHGHAAHFKRWPLFFPDSVEIVAFSWPRALPDDYPSFLSALTQEIRPHLDTPFAVFGYSLGGIPAFGLANILRNTFSLEPAALFLAATCAPSTERVVQSEVRERLRNALSETVGATGFEALYGEQEGSFWQAHRKACETYPPFRCSLTAFGGQRDLMIPRQVLESWANHTSGSFSVQMIDGDHSFPFEHTTLLIESMKGTLHLRD